MPKITLGKFLKSAALGYVSLHTLKTIHGTQIKPYKKVEAPDELNKPQKQKPKTNPIGYFTRVWSGENMGHLEFKFDFMFAQPKETLIYSQSDLASWLKERILSDNDKKSPFIKIKSIRNQTVTFVFNEELWLEKTLKNAKVEVGYIPNKLIIKWTVPLPDMVMIHYSRPFLGPYLSKKLHQYFKRHRSAMKFQKWFKWLDKINPDFFTYNVDFFKSAFILTVKNSVILGAVLTALGIKKIISK